MKSKIYFPDVYVEKSLFVINRFKDNDKNFGGCHKKSMINLKDLNLKDREIWDFLNGLRLRGRSGKSIIFKKETTQEIAQLLGFIITDGSLLSTEGRVKLCQKDPSLLHLYLDIINKEYNTNLNFSFNGKEINVSSVPLRYILNKYYNIPLGKKVRTVDVPIQIINSTNGDILRSFIAGLFDGDGYIQCYYLKKKNILDHANFCISTASHKLIKQCVFILDRLDIKCSISKRNDGRLTLQTSGFLNSLKFYNQIIPLIFHRKRKENANKIFLSKDFIGKFTVFLDDNLKSLFREIRKRKLDQDLLNISLRHKYINSLRSIESWIYQSKHGKVRSVYIYRACKLLNKEPNNYIPIDQLKFIGEVYNGDKE